MLISSVILAKKNQFSNAILLLSLNVAIAIVRLESSIVLRMSKFTIEKFTRSPIDRIIIV